LGRTSTRTGGGLKKLGDGYQGKGPKGGKGVFELVSLKTGGGVGSGLAKSPIREIFLEKLHEVKLERE